MSFRNTTRVSNSLDPDKAQHLVGPFQDTTVYKVYQQTTKDVTGRQRVEKYKAQD